MSILHEALLYASRGWPVFPVFEPAADGTCSCGTPDCGDAAKHPRIAGGHRNATADEQQVRRWWGRWPAANVGIATGRPSGLWVLDLDGDEGTAAFAALTKEYGALPRTPTVRSGGGGRHYYFAWAKKMTSVNRLGGLPIDRRCDGGYIIAPPSRHRSGTAYSWEVAPDEVPLAAAPAWLVEWMTSAPRPRKRRTATTAATPSSAPPPATSPSRPPVPPATANGLRFSVVAGGADLRARGVAYLAACPPSISGSGGHVALLNAARGLVTGLGLDDATAIELLASSYNPRCEPPWSERELRHKIDEVRSTPFGKPNGYLLSDAPAHLPSLVAPAADHADDIEAASTPEPEPWPALAEDAYHGIIGDVVRAIEPHTEADPAAMLFQLLAATGNAIGRGPHVFADGARHHGNLFVVVVGNSAKARKGTSASRARQVLRLADPRWHDERIVNGLSSGEGLIAQVADPGQDDSDAALKFVVEDKRLYVEEGEFASVLEVLRREGNTLSPVLRSAWDGTTIQTLTKQRLRASGAHVSVTGHITADELHERIKGRDLTNGFANRFLWIAAKKSKLLARGGGQLDLGPLGVRLGQAITSASAETTFEFTSQAGDEWEAAYLRLEQEQRGTYGAVVARASAQALRLALLFAALDGHHAIGTPHLRAALAAWSYADASARRIFGVEPEDPLVEKVLERLRRAGPAGMTRTELYRSFGNNVQAALIQRTLSCILERGTGRFVREATGGQRHAERWFATP